MDRKSIQLGFCLLAFALAASAQTNVTNSNNGTTNAVPVYSGSATLGNSPISVSGSNVGIGTTNPTDELQLLGGNIGIEDTTCGTVRSLYFEAIDDSLRNYVQAYSTCSPGTDYLQLGSFYGAVQIVTGASSTPTARVTVLGNGAVGIGTTSPGAKLEVNGGVKLTANSGASITFQDGTVQSTAYTGVTCGGDFAESVKVSGQRESYAPGDVLVLTPNGNGDVAMSSQPYSTLVAGIYSTKPGYVGRRLTTPKGPDEVPMAMLGIVPTKVSAENGPIRRGDLLVTGSLHGYAMKGTDPSRMIGAVIGKAMGSLESGIGVIEVLVTLQ
jgi:hypothetical protein